jgi:hypothetical protein
MNIEIVDINEDYNSNNLDVKLRSNNGAVGNVSVRAFPSLAVDYTEMTSAGQIDVVSLNVSDQQDSIQAASQNCNIEVSENLVR